MCDLKVGLCSHAASGDGSAVIGNRSLLLGQVQPQVLVLAADHLADARLPLTLLMLCYTPVPGRVLVAAFPLPPELLN